MKAVKDIKFDKDRVQLYLWLGGAFLTITFLGELFDSSDQLLRRLINHLWQILLLTVIHFILLEHIARHFRLTVKRVLLSIIIASAFLMIYGFGTYAWIQFGEKLWIYFPVDSFPSWEAEMENIMAYTMGSLFFFILVRHIYDYRNLKLRAHQLQIEKQMAELNYLKSQTNPHFLFNTLNNIFSLARDKSDHAAESIMRLSKILRFMLYETSGEFISLDQELKIIEDYMALEQLRYDDTLRVNYSHDLEDKKQAIPPLILIPLVENAFKHGVSETRKDPYISIHLAVQNRRLHFIVKNSVESSKIDMDVNEKIGLSNLRRQLELLYTDYELTLKREESEFSANLKINLASHVHY